MITFICNVNPVQRMQTGYLIDDQAHKLIETIPFEMKNFSSIILNNNVNSVELTGNSTYLKIFIDKTREQELKKFNHNNISFSIK